jgi:hypothetical protein
MIAIHERPIRLRRRRPSIRFAALAWLKLQYFCHAGDSEISGFAITSHNDPLYVEDFVTVRQHASWMSVSLDDQAVADFMDRWVDQGLPLQNVLRIWIHTHPGASVEPSSVDEATFARVFGACDWAVMFILGRTGNTYARLAIQVGPGATLQLPTEVDWTAWPKAVNDPAFALAGCLTQWREEFAANILPFPPTLPSPCLLPAENSNSTTSRTPSSETHDGWTELDQELWEEMEHDERTYFNDRRP